MIKHQEIDLLLGYTPRDGVLISFYLNTDWSERSKGVWGIEAKDMIKSARREVQSLQVNRRYEEAAEEDLRRIQSSLQMESLGQRHKSIVIFANSAENFYQIYKLPVPLKSKIVVDTSFYVRPLQALLEERCRLGVVITDSRSARLFEIFMGEIIEHVDFTKSIKRAKQPILETFMKREKRLMQRKEEEARVHIAEVAELVKSHFARNDFDKLLIGARKPLGDHLARLMNRRLQENLIGIFEIDIHASDNEVLRHATMIEAAFELDRETRLARKIKEELEKNGRGVKGLRETIEMLHDYNVQVLAVSDDYSAGGLVCHRCGMPHFDGKTCVICGEELTSDSDIVFDIIEEAARQRATVRHFKSSELLTPLENIAAIIKFKTGELIHPEEVAETES